ncbi:hypothetical protein D3C73_891360 [compost metagenome]
MQCAQDLHLGNAVRAVERQVDGQGVQFEQVRGYLGAILRQYRVPGACAHVLRPAFRIAEDRCHARVHTRRNPARQQQPVDQRRRKNADGDFLHAGDGNGEDVTGHHHRREADQAGGVPGQQEGIRTRCAVEHGQVQAQAHPGRQHHAQHQGRVGEPRHQQHRSNRAADGSQQAEQAPAERCAGHRLRHQIDRADHPERAGQADAQRDIQPEDRGEQALEREQHRFAVDLQCGRRQQRTGARKPGAGGGGNLHAAIVFSEDRCRISLECQPIAESGH